MCDWKDRWTPKGTGKCLALRTPRAMECVWGDLKDTLSTTTEFTTMRMVTTMRKVRYLSRVRQAGGWVSVRHLIPRCHPPCFPHDKCPRKGRGYWGCSSLPEHVLSKAPPPAQVLRSGKQV